MKELSKTLFIPLFYKYMESIEKKEIVDEEALKFFQNNGELLEKLKKLKNDKQSYNGIISRTILIDKNILKILSEKEIDFIVTIGCGLDYRCKRLNINIPWYHIDLPEVIEYRQKNIGILQDNQIDMEGDILNLEFISNLPKGRGIFLFEGILVYFNKEKVYEVLNAFGEKYENSYYIMDSCPEELIKDLTWDKKDTDVFTKSIELKWGNNNYKSLEKDLGMKYICGDKILETLKERWDYNSFGNMKNIIINNFRIDVYKK